MRKIIIDWYKRLIETKTHDLGKDQMVFRKHGDWIRTEEVYRLVMYLEGRIKSL